MRNRHVLAVNYIFIVTSESEFAIGSVLHVQGSLVIAINHISVDYMVLNSCENVKISLRLDLKNVYF